MRSRPVGFSPSSPAIDAPVRVGVQQPPAGVVDVAARGRVAAACGAPPRPSRPGQAQLGRPGDAPLAFSFSLALNVSVPLSVAEVLGRDRDRHAQHRAPQRADPPS